MYALIFSDLHLDFWLRGNPEPEYRMKKQPMMLAQRIDEEMKRYKTDILFNLGDTLNHWNSPPQILGVLCDFYGYLVKSNPLIKIYYIEGQHSIYKRDDNNVDNSYVHLISELFPNNVMYMHDKSLNIEGTTIYMANYSRKGPIYPKTYHDIFLSHVSLGFVECDSPNYSLGVFGDIHNFVDDGKNHSVGTPYQHHSFEPQEGKLGLLDLKGRNSTFTRINSDSDKIKFLKFEKVKKMNFNLQNEDVEEARISGSSIMEMIENEVKKRGLESIHAEMNRTDLPVPINFNFSLHKIIIDNVRSIEHLEIDFESLGHVIYVNGKNGVGKSSIFESIFLSLAGERSLRSFRRNTAETPLRIQIWLTYENLLYYIDRGESHLSFTVNGKEITMSKKETQAELIRRLPWIPYLSYLYIKAKNEYFGSINKTELLKMIFNLNIFNSLTKESFKLLDTTGHQIRDLERDMKVKEELIKENEESLRKIQEDINKLETSIVTTRSKEEIMNSITSLQNLNFKRAQLETLEKVRKERLEVIHQELTKGNSYQMDETTVSTKLSEVNSLLSQCKNEKEKFYEAKSQLSNINQRINILGNLKVERCPYCDAILKGEDHFPEIEELSKQSMELKTKIETWQLPDEEKLQEDVRNLLYIQNDLEKVKKLKQEFEKLTQESFQTSKDLLALTDEIVKIISPNGEKPISIEEYIKNSQELLSNLTLKEKLLISFSEQKVRLDKLKNEFAEAQKVHKELKDKQILIEKYYNLFNITSKESIPYAILKGLVTHLNTDKIKFEVMKDTGEFDVNAYIKVGEEWINYNKASTGQKAYLDLFIIIRLTSFIKSVGLLILDESFVNLDEDALASAMLLIPEISANQILISSHTRVLDIYNSEIALDMKDGKTIMIES